MKKKVKRFQEGGFTEEQEEFLGGADRTDPYILARMRSKFPDKPQAKESFETKTGRNANISDDVREKAMRSVMADDSPAGKTSYGEQNELPEPVKRSVTKTTVAVTKPETKSTAPAMPADEKARLEKILEKQKLGRVEPEGFIPGPRMIANLLKSGANLLGKKKLREYSMDEFEKMTPKLGRESLKLTREPAKLPMKKGGAVKKMASGGKVSSASRRGDGCAIRGKTKGRMM
jgi:hypothetical protein